MHGYHKSGYRWPQRMGNFHDVAHVNRVMRMKIPEVRVPRKIPPCALVRLQLCVRLLPCPCGKQSNAVHRYDSAKTRKIRASVTRIPLPPRCRGWFVARTPGKAQTLDLNQKTGRPDAKSRSSYPYHRRRRAAMAPTRVLVCACVARTRGGEAQQDGPKLRGLQTAVGPLAVGRGNFPGNR